MKNFVNFFCLDIIFVSLGIFLISAGSIVPTIEGVLIGVVASYWASEDLLKLKKGVSLKNGRFTF